MRATRNILTCIEVTAFCSSPCGDLKILMHSNPYSLRPPFSLSPSPKKSRASPDNFASFPSLERPGGGVVEEVLQARACFDLLLDPNGGQGGEVVQLHVVWQNGVGMVNAGLVLVDQGLAVLLPPSLVLVHPSAKQSQQIHAGLEKKDGEREREGRRAGCQDKILFLSVGGGVVLVSPGA